MASKKNEFKTEINITIIGEWKFNIYEQAFARGLEMHGINVKKVSLKEILDNEFSSFEYLFPFKSRKTKKLNEFIIQKVVEINSEIALFWRPTHVLNSTIMTLNKMGIETITYNNDNPFNNNLFMPLKFKFKWRLYRSAIKASKYNFFYRPENLQKAIKKQISKPHLLLPYFRPWNDRKVILTNSEIKRYQTDIVFIGHYEDDGRDSMLLKLIEADIDVKIWGDLSWRKVKNPLFKKHFKSIEKVEEEDYTKALNGGKICLNFFSKINNDLLTRRCFEIPASHCLLLSERSEFLSSILKEDHEAVYFNNLDQLLYKAKWLLSNKEDRERITKNGYKKVHLNHSVYDRAKEFLNKISK